MDSNLYKKFPFHFHGKMYEIRVFKDEEGYKVKVYLDNEPVFDHGYKCTFEEDKQYKKLMGKFGWQRLVFVAKADLSGKAIYRYTPKKAS